MDLRSMDVGSCPWAGFSRADFAVQIVRDHNRGWDVGVKMRNQPARTEMQQKSQPVANYRRRGRVAAQQQATGTASWQ
eukprot:352500-Chlamydomonas_euryale.AAC.5